MEMLNIMQSRLERMNIQKDTASQILGNFITVLMSVEFTNNIFKNQQRSTIDETPLRFRYNLNFLFSDCMHRQFHKKWIAQCRFEDCIAASEDFAMSSVSFNTLYELMVMGFKRQVPVQTISDREICCWLFTGCNVFVHWRTCDCDAKKHGEAR